MVGDDGCNSEELARAQKPRYPSATGNYTTMSGLPPVGSFDSGEDSLVAFLILLVSGLRLWLIHWVDQLTMKL